MEGVVKFFFVVGCQDTVSSAFLISSTEGGGGSGWVNPFRVCFVRSVWSVVVECLGLKPRYVGESGMSCFMLLGIIFSYSLDNEDRRIYGDRRRGRW